MERLTFATAVRLHSSGNTITNEYTVPINPDSIDEVRFQSTGQLEIKYGQDILQVPTYNGSERTLSWGQLPARETFETMVDTLKSYRGSNVFLKINSAGTFQKEIWVPILVIDVVVNYPDAPGTRFYYRGVDFVYSVIKGFGYNCGRLVYHQDNPYPPAGGEPGDDDDFFSPIEPPT